MDTPPWLNVCKKGGVQSGAHPNSGGHEIGTHFGKVTAQYAVVEAVEEKGYSEIHGIFRLYSEGRQKRDTGNRRQNISENLKEEVGS